MKTILVVEDDSSLRTVIRMVLEDNGYAVTEARHGGEALDQMAANAPDLVVADVRMPVVGGIELLRRMRQSPELAGIKAILLTGDSSVSPVDSLADAALIKPFDAAELAGVVAGLTGIGSPAGVRRPNQREP